MALSPLSRVGVGASSGSPRVPLAGKGRVLVVGGGLAGLTAAYELERSGWEVVVLEARPRLGGRVYTVHDFAGDQHAEAGGEYVDSGHRELRAYAREFAIPLEDARRGFGGLDAVVFRGGERHLAWRYRTPEVRRQSARFWRSLYDLVARVDLDDPGSGIGRALDRRSLADLMDELGIDGRARFLLERGIRDDYATEPERLSLLFVALSERAGWNQPDAGREIYRLRGGNSRLVEAFADRLAGEVLTGAPVTAIEHTATGVAATIADGRSFSGAHCVLAAPLPALRAVSFTPALPEPLARAIAELEYGPVAKALLQYERRYWRRRGFSGDVASDLPMGSAWEATDQQPGRSGILLAYASGAGGIAAAELTERERITGSAADLERIFPGSRRLLLRSHSVAWTAEPYSGGGWSTYSPGQVLDFWTALREPVGRIQLAGEHTSDLSGYMESAIRSGRRAAQRIDQSGGQ